MITYNKDEYNSTHKKYKTNSELSSNAVIVRLRDSEDVCLLCGTPVRDHLICNGCTILIGGHHYENSHYRMGDKVFCSECARRRYESSQELVQNIHNL